VFATFITPSSVLVLLSPLSPSSPLRPLLSPELLIMSSVGSTHSVNKNVTKHKDITNDVDAEFGGTEARKRLEKRLLLKLDARMSILIVIYILNYIDRNNAAYVDFILFYSFLTSTKFTVQLV
jgi:hypothetical protein